MIRIRLAIIDNDKMYADRLCFALNSKYGSKLEIYLFNDAQKAIDELNKIKTDVVLVDSEISISKSDVSNGTAFAYLCSSSEINTIKGEKAIGKYQKIDIFYKSVLSLYADKIDNDVEIAHSVNKKKSTLFLSAAGGTGCSALGISYAMRLAQHSKKPLYINLEPFGDISILFNNEGSQSLSDVIYALKSKKSNLPLKLQSAMKTSADGIYYFDSCNLALDLLDATQEDYKLLFDAVCSIDIIDEIIIDTAFSMSDKDIVLMKKVQQIIAVSDGSEISNSKTNKMLRAIDIIDEQNNALISKKVRIFYNKFSSKNSTQIENIEFVGGIPKYEGFSYSKIINKIAGLSDLDKI